MPLRIHLISHACVLLETEDCRILADPWLIGRAFNDSWRLWPQPEFDGSLLDGVDYLWISHEHPDHFNVPTLRMLPDSFRKRVTVLFQRNNSRKMFEAFARLGYPNHRALGHREIVRLDGSTDVYCYQVGQMDSCLGVRDSRSMVMNVNDAYTNVLDARRIRGDFGEPDALLDQFSIAGYGGFEDYDRHLRAMAAGHIDHMLETHSELNARVTIPFASFILFCCEDNRYVNDYANSTKTIADRFASAGSKLAVLHPGDVYDTEAGEEWDSLPAIERLEAQRREWRDVDFEVSAPIALEEIDRAFQGTCARLRSRYPSLVLRLLRPVTVWIPDLRKMIRFSVADSRFEEIPHDEKADLIVRSQPLWFTFNAPFGLQTLGVSARFVLRNEGDAGNWARHRSLFGLCNAEIYLRPKFLFSGATLRHLWARRHGLLSQIRTRLELMRVGR